MSSNKISIDIEIDDFFLHVHIPPENQSAVMVGYGQTSIHLGVPVEMAEIGFSSTWYDGPWNTFGFGVLGMLCWRG